MLSIIKSQKLWFKGAVREHCETRKTVDTVF